MEDSPGGRHRARWRRWPRARRGRTTAAKEELAAASMAAALGSVEGVTGVGGGCAELGEGGGRLGEGGVGRRRGGCDDNEEGRRRARWGSAAAVRMEDEGGEAGSDNEEGRRRLVWRLGGGDGGLGEGG
uniref:Uncharacterized protein n=1 Tax=Oryza sativa subsp. japonica TaxID=39947 RepID=Q6ERH7_ORYSJ|nr:hypothetical protein [Oryza sativa Japonica Group]